MKVLHVIGGISQQAGGPSRSSQGLVAAECAAGVDAWLCPLNGGTPWLPGVRKVDPPPSTSTSDLSLFLKTYDLIHIHGIWDPRLHKVAVVCRKAGVPYVIAPRGMLEPWSLKAKWLKKRIARFLYQDRDLHCAAALQATAESEAEQFRKLGFGNPVIISPNGVNVPDGKQVEVKSGSGRAEDNLLSTTNNYNSNRPHRALFVSRMHPKKGVIELVESWARVFKSDNHHSQPLPLTSDSSPWQCELVYTLNGETERTYEAKVKQRILDLGLSYAGKDGTIHSSTSTSHFDFLLTGPLDDNAKWSAYARADLFVLPTYSENFGIVVAEALWAGLPVITTKGTPWSDLVTNECGWWIDLPAEDSRSSESKSKNGGWKALDDALREATSANYQLPPTNHQLPATNYQLPTTNLRDMGANGHRLVMEKYTWPAIAKQMIVAYKGILHVLS